MFFVTLHHIKVVSKTIGFFTCTWFHAPRMTPRIIGEDSRRFAGFWKTLFLEMIQRCLDIFGDFGDMV
jgi:hypothetical protein